MSARSGIVDKLVELLNTIDGTGIFRSNLFTNATKRLQFWDEVTDFPHVSVVAGSELREYKPGGFKWGYLSVSLKVYIQGEDTILLLENLLQDIEVVIDQNNELEYDTGLITQDIRITSIETDEGLLNPLGVGEVNLQILYEVQH